MPDPHLKQVSPGHWQVQGKITSTLVLGQPGVYTFAPGASVEIPVGQSLKMIGIDIRADGVTLEDPRVTGGFRQINIQGRSHTIIRRPQLLRAGVPGSGHGTGGHGILANDGRDCTIEGGLIEGSQGHALYFGQTWDGLKIRGTKFRGHGGHSPLFQLNSEGGSHILGVRCEDCEFQEDSPSRGLINLWGAGSQTDPVLFTRCVFRGGAGGLNVDAVGNSQGGRPSFAVVDGGELSNPGGLACHVWNKSRLTLRGGVKVTGQKKADSGGVIQ